jgi:hypothetical protein
VGPSILLYSESRTYTSRGVTDDSSIQTRPDLGTAQAAVEQTCPGAEQSAVEQTGPGEAQAAVEQSRPGAAHTNIFGQTRPREDRTDTRAFVLHLNVFVFKTLCCTSKVDVLHVFLVFHFFSVCFEAVLFVSVVSKQVRKNETNRKKYFLGFAKQPRKTTETD